MENTYLVRWIVNSWTVWFCDYKGHKHYSGTYHGPVADYVAACSKAGYSVIILGSR